MSYRSIVVFVLNRSRWIYYQWFYFLFGSHHYKRHFFSKASFTKHRRLFTAISNNFANMPRMIKALYKGTLFMNLCLPCRSRKCKLHGTGFHLIMTGLVDLRFEWRTDKLQTHIQHYSIIYQNKYNRPCKSGINNGYLGFVELSWTSAVIIVTKSAG